jgi:hypothetical protein
MTTNAIVGAIASLATLACSSTNDERTADRSEEQLGRSRSAIVGGTSSDAARDFAVMLVFSDPATNRRGICTAALVAPRLVLTARHCVSETDLDVACGADGSARIGGAIRGNHDARKLTVFTGRDRPDLDSATVKPAGRGLEVLDDGAKNLCDHDLALVLLESPIEGVPVASLRLDGDAEGGEGLTTIGWGVTTTTNEPPTRQERSGVKVTRIGPDEKSPVLTPSEFTFDESICLGDSGGPVVSARTGAIIGVVSRGGNGSSSNEPSATCTAATNLATKLGPFRELVARGFSRAGAQPVLEERASEEDGGGCSVPRRAGARSGTGTGTGTGTGAGTSAWFAVAIVAMALGRRRL